MGPDTWTSLQAHAILVLVEVSAHRGHDHYAHMSSIACIMYSLPIQNWFIVASISAHKIVISSRWQVSNSTLLITSSFLHFLHLPLLSSHTSFSRLPPILLLPHLHFPPGRPNQKQCGPTNTPASSKYWRVGQTTWANGVAHECW